MKKSIAESMFRTVLFLAVALLPTLASQAQQTGKASYYSNRLHGLKMSDGTRYHKDSMTCAHRTLPFGTMLKVTRLSNGEEVIVEVTDRGPFVRGRIVDLSYAAAEQLGMIGSGITRVSVERVEPWIPFMSEKHSTIPQLKLADPDTGEYLTIAEANELINRKLEKKARHLALVRPGKPAEGEPRYRMMRAAITATN